MYFPFAGALFFLALLPCPAQTELPREVLLLSRIRQRMSEVLDQLPNCTCLETITRFRKETASGPFRRIDRLRLEVALIGKKELFSWPGSGRFEDKSITEMIDRGTIGSGDFANFARAVFLSHAATINHAGEDLRHRRRALRYNYQMPLFQSGYRVRVDDRAAVVAYHGSFWVDAETLDLLRLQVLADQIPLELGLAEVVTELEYRKIPLGAGLFLLPATAESVMAFSSGRASRNRIEFTDCRQFAAESSISFEQPAASRAGSNRPQQLITLPAGIEVQVRLETPIDSEKSAIGDLIAARVDREVKSEGRLLLTKGALLEGRIRQLESFTSPAPYFEVGLILTGLRLEKWQAPFFADLEEVGPLPALFGDPTRPQDSGSSRKLAAPTIRARYLPQAPGIGFFYIAGSRCQLPKGLRMVWRTKDKPSP